MDNLFLCFNFRSCIWLIRASIHQTITLKLQDHLIYVKRERHGSRFQSSFCGVTMIRVTYRSALLKEFIKALMLIIFCLTLWFQIFGDFINGFFRGLALVLSLFCILGLLDVLRYIKKLEQTIKDAYGELWYSD